MELWHRFDDFMQEWYTSNLPWSDIALAVVGYAIGSTALVVHFLFIAQK